ncbi:YqhG family protein [Paenibacillus thalictri]|uniref:Uncharacterized protein n=1 Tax=Paenibacillus thalictri TaxID=2527873 RepID=A0A4Q9DLK0_9BACL|nr:YqhG family protein [Paenibacillus thalictri]TBL73355.1 hypothetical protein EYB31_27140 [Paenibacillus thalictri]
MKTGEIQQFVMRYLETEQCQIIEKHPAYVTVKLSPSADRALTNRPYYWSFVERTGAAPETMTFTLVFDPDKAKDVLAAKYPQAGAASMPGAGAAGVYTANPSAAPGVPMPSGSQSQPGGGNGLPSVSASPAGSEPVPDGSAEQAQSSQPDSILGRYFGFVPTPVVSRMPRDDVTFGSRRLEQIFDAVKAKGKYVRLFEEPPQGHRSAPASLPYDSWLHANYLVEFACDMKRTELHSLAIRLSTGEIKEDFDELLDNVKLTPRLPANIHIIPDKMSLSHGSSVLERYLENRLKDYDHRWAEEAHDRLLEELERIRLYYESLIKAAEDDKKPDFEGQYRNRQAEIEWQYRPRVHISVINCGLFHFHTPQRP